MSDSLNGAAAVKTRFHGGRVSGYEERRAKRPFWAKENAAVSDMLYGLPKGSSVLDIPVGTGRYAPLYHTYGLNAVGMDVSADMLDYSKTKIAEIGSSMQVRFGNALAIEAGDRSFNAVVCTRLVNWFLPEEMKRAIFEISRVAKDRVILSIELGARLSEKGNKPHEPAVYAAAVKAAKMVEKKRVEILPGYWMILLERA